MENEFLRNTFDNINGFLRRIGIKTWPALFMFVVVLCATAWLNFETMSPVVGEIGAALIACFFGVGVLAWHTIAARTDDSEYQEGVANFVKWANVVLDAVLLVVNLFRAENPLVLDWVAFGIIGLSAVSHVVGFLLWTENDPRRAIRKEGERSISEIDKKRMRATNAINTAGESLKFEKWLIDEESRLRSEYREVDPQKVNDIVKVMQTEARKQFERKQESGNEKPAKRPQEAPHAPQNAPMMANAADTKAEALETDPNAPRGGQN